MAQSPVITSRYARRLLVVWLVALLAITLYPLGFLHLRTVPRLWVWTPIRADTWLELAANIAFFVPLGILARSARLATPLALGLSMLLSFSIESSQAWIRWRFPTYTDWVANVAGVAFGLMVARPFLQHRKRLLNPMACGILFFAGVAVSVVVAAAETRFLHFGWSFTFGLAILGGTLARGFASTRGAIAAAFAGALAVAAVQPEPPGLMTIASIAVGAALGVWPAYQAERACASA